MRCHRDEDNGLKKKGTGLSCFFILFRRAEEKKLTSPPNVAVIAVGKKKNSRRKVNEIEKNREELRGRRHTNIITSQRTLKKKVERDHKRG